MMSEFVDEQRAKPIALIPIGQVEEAILAIIGEGLREAFGRDYVIAAPPRPTPATPTTSGGGNTGRTISWLGCVA